MKNVSGRNCRENENTHFIFNILFSDNRAFYDIAWKNKVRAGQATDETAHALCMQDN
jgi:hypothetical protein